LLEVQGEKSGLIHIVGDLSHVKKIGYGMTRGRIAIEDDVGMHLGATMSSGEIVVEANASDWLGAEMRRGTVIAFQEDRIEALQLLPTFR